MRSLTTPLLLALGIGLAAGSRPDNTSICDYYTAALLATNNATNQLTLLALLVNTAVIGNYTTPNVGVAVPGILAAGMYNGTKVNLLPFFDGGLASTNRGGSAGVAVNFLDDGAAVPLMRNRPANGTASNQYKLLTHLYSYFGTLLGCSMVGQMGFPAYGGQGSQYAVHKYMALDAFQLGYFIEQVGLSAASFGVAAADVDAVGVALQKLFGYKCEAPEAVVEAQGEGLQSICTADDCPTAQTGNCSAYGAVIEPAVTNATLAMGEGSNSTMMNSTGMSNGTMTVSGSGGSIRMTVTGSAATASATGMGAEVAAQLRPAVALIGAAALAFAL